MVSDMERVYAPTTTRDLISPSNLSDVHPHPPTPSFFPLSTCVEAYVTLHHPRTSSSLPLCSTVQVYITLHHPRTSSSLPLCSTVQAYITLHHPGTSSSVPLYASVQVYATTCVLIFTSSISYERHYPHSPTFSSRCTPAPSFNILPPPLSYSHL